jgi:HNH endonuclease
LVSVYISVDLRNRIRESDGDRCCYCLTTELNSGSRMVFDHIYPRAKGGETSFENVCLACRACNEYKSDTIEALDSMTDLLTPLFNPRCQSWQDHFDWIQNDTEIQGKTAVGRVTVAILQMNHGAIVATRQRWVAVGWHPPG